MGLGKTLTILSYLKIVKDKKEKLAKQKKKELENDNEDEDNDDEEDFRTKKIYKKRLTNRIEAERLKTLIILPASLLHQWEGEIKSKFERDAFKYHVYHEANRKKYAYNLEDNDIVFSTYEIISREVSIDKEGTLMPNDSPLTKITWKRIILDEAHRIKNHNTKANKSVCALKAKYRIAITGTPVHNSINDLYSLIKFIHFEPLNDFTLWGYLFAIEKKSNGTGANSAERQKRSNSWIAFLSDYILLRRGKNDKLKGSEKKLVDLPEKNYEIIKFPLQNFEKTIYDKIFKESQEKVKTFLTNRQMGRSGNSTVSEILVYLLRLRQACCHMVISSLN
jgi:SNF2 family DNA or RNA helicase